MSVIDTTLTGTNRAVVHFYNGRGTAEQWIKEGKEAVERRTFNGSACNGHSGYSFSRRGAKPPH